MPKSLAKAKADAKYNKKVYERIAFNVRRDAEINGDAIRIHAATQGESVNGFISRAIAEAMKRDKTAVETLERDKVMQFFSCETITQI